VAGTYKNRMVFGEELLVLLDAKGRRVRKRRTERGRD
jgi:hypothetical protein